MLRQTRVSNANMMTLPEKLSRFSWGLFVPMCMVLAISILVLFSAGGGNWRPFALSQMMKIMLGFGVFFFAAFTNIKTWVKSAYVIYAVALIMIVLVTFVGHTGMGAQRWLNLGIIHIQPSELIKIALVLALARYFAWFNSVELGQFKNYLAPMAMLLVPFGLIVAQPDLGTALSLGMITVGMFYIVGANKKWFVIAAILGCMAAPVVWYGGLHDYQRGRIITFLNPDSDIQG
ncbi:MAG: FtsW/RodA/SpoVE family cell cycle protein, partial [Alphaproteobacteria bacterium]|nr:FtsW/RodA/SpoVE family cell cycle protein [Alphaproteobacteria bacterium]